MPKFKSWLVVVCFLVIALASPAKAWAVESTTPAPSNIETTFVDLVYLARCVIYGGNDADGPCFGQPTSAAAPGVLTMGYAATDIFFQTPPLSTTQYLSSLSRKFNPVPVAEAQVGGSGSSVVSTIFIFWEAARNIAYVVMTLVFVLVGLMVLLGRKSGGQSVLTVQAAIPGLAVSLIMITFSYFFAALLTDIAFYGCYLVGYIFVTILNVSTAEPANILGANNLIQIFMSFIFNGFNFTSIIAFIYSLSDSDLLMKLIIVGFGGFLGSQIVAPLGTLIGGAIPGFNLALLGQAIGSLAGAGGVVAVQRLPELLVGVFLYVILGLALIFALFKLLKDLIQRYITILFLTIFAPFIFLAQSWPGQSKGYEGWFKNMLCNALAFPAVFAAFYFAAYFLVGDSIFQMRLTRGITDGTIPFPSFGPIGGFPLPTRSFNTLTTLPLFGGYNLGIINQVIGFGILLTTPAIPDYICKTLGGKLDEVFGKEISANFSSGQTRVTRYGRSAGSGVTRLGREIDEPMKKRGRSGGTTAGGPGNGMS